MNPDRRIPVRRLSHDEGTQRRRVEAIPTVDKRHGEACLRLS
jgi:hypothetical protein